MLLPGAVQRPVGARSASPVCGENTQIADAGVGQLRIPAIAELAGRGAFGLTRPAGITNSASQWG